ncbi:methyl-accepting chemotaxis protein [Pseudobutyrivibrio sp.]|uniref:methyl-accepting chemotaxis protein n=1 Tax=Pseudobutyrivibrio sp. TaxID=2014367 RepID=UPI0025D2D620|nr:methyl-accepting chemotaxis protein [Pseudobutyrivibrio sp.]
MKVKRGSKRGSLKRALLTKIIIYSAIIIVIISQISIKLAVDNIEPMTYRIISGESVTYAKEIQSWWNSVEQRVAQTADVIGNSPDISHEDMSRLLMKLTEDDPDSQDIYMAYGNEPFFIDGSGWVPDDTFVFTDRPWYIGALNNKGAIYSSDPYVDASTGKTCIACSVMIRDNVVLSSDINFDKVVELVQNFSSYSNETRYYIINKETKDILISNVEECIGQTLSDTTDPVAKGLSAVYDSLDTSLTGGAAKVKNASTDAGGMMFAATDIQDTSWVVVSAVPSTILSDAIVKVMVLTMGIGLLLMIIMSVIMYFTISKAIGPVNTVTERLTDISQGDFTVALVPEGNNEITTLSESLNAYIEKMRSTLNSLSGISGEMNSRAGECFDISHSLSGANQNQSESIEKLNSTLNDMTKSIEEIAEAAGDLAATSSQLATSAEDVRSLCDETMEASGKGKEEMSHMTKNVSTLNNTISELTALIKATAKSVEEITGITEAINAISAQTNLLSLNASIEAARAGEMGKGFAVVAQEVGVLANQSSEATDTIRRLIDDITRNIEDINKKADICVEDMEACISGVEGANDSFNTIYEDVSKATEGINQIAGGIEKINGVASSNAETTKEQVSSINEVLGLSDMIVTESNKLRQETENITNVSENLSKYSDEINSDLSQYTL